MAKQTEYLSVSAAVFVLKVSRVTIYKWIANGLLDSADIAGRTVIVVNQKFRRAGP